MRSIEPRYNRDFDPDTTTLYPLNDNPQILRLTAPNAGPFTFRGTNSYLLGRDSVAIIDPGPEDAGHIARLIAAAEANGPVSHILLTHHHGDHTGAVEALRKHFGVPVFGRPPIDPNAWGAVPIDVVLEDGDELSGADWTLDVAATPGHASSHLVFALRDTNHLFSGDHVMGWSTSVIIPPDGSLRDFLSSIDRLMAFPQDHYHCGHGSSLPKARLFARRLASHRRLRNEQILRALKDSGAMDLEGLREAVYPRLDANLHDAAKATLGAHLIYLEEEGAVKNLEGRISLDG